MFGTYEDLRNAVEKNEGVLTVSMADLKQIAQAGRLGIHVRGEISQQLLDAGLDHSPKMLPSFQTELVRLYVPNTEAAAVIEAVEEPSLEGDQTLTSNIKKRPGRRANQKSETQTANAEAEANA